MPAFVNNAVFWVEVEKIKPNPFQPRREFDEGRLSELAESIRMYGILQPLVVTRKEIAKEDGGLATEYELISGERRLRASRLAGLSQVPVLIRQGEENDREKLELAIIENLQREDLNAVDRARAFKRLASEFGFKHAEIGKKVGKSREYVSNTLRILDLSEEILTALSEGKINEGHTRPLLMLSDRPQEQMTLFKEIMYKKVTVREAENIARRIAYDRARKKEFMAD
ncbi:MAG: ParB/RepB/Spo0J family partition protein, partial [bacterium]|nr:ParB/RepB/Spo0J family partition protein [bacterium]